MIVNITNSIDISSFSSNWESGIDWRSIGGEWKALDRGSDTQKYSATITIKGTESAVSVIRDIVSDASKAGDTVTLKFGEYEKVFGSELSYASAFVCYIGDAEGSLQTDADNADYRTFTFEAWPDGDMTAYYAYSPLALPSGLMIQSIDRSSDTANTLTENEASVLGQGLGHESPTTEITYIARSSVSGEAIAYLKNLRGLSFPMIMTQGLWIFTYGTFAEDVCVIDVQSNGMLDKACLYESFTVTYGRGVAQIIDYTLERLTESVVSMLCYDGTDGKANAFTLHPVFSDAGDHATACTWTTSDNTKAVVSSSGVVSAVSGGTGSVTISCTLLGVTKTATFTVYSTIPNANTLYTLPGGKFSGAFFTNTSDVSLLGNIGSLSIRGKFNTSANATVFRLKSTHSDSIQIDFTNGKLQRYNFSISGTIINRTQYEFTTNTGSNIDLDVFCLFSSSSIIICNSTNLNGSNIGTVPVTFTDLLGLYFISGAGTSIVTATGDGASATVASLRDRSSSKLFYIPQNYVKYTDIDALVNYTEILNIGTESGFNLSCNNTPSGWF